MKKAIGVISVFFVVNLGLAVSTAAAEAEVKSVDLDTARELIVAAREIAAERGFLLSFAVADAEGYLLCSDTMPGAKRMTVRNAIDKSHTAALRKDFSLKEGDERAPKGPVDPKAAFLGRKVSMQGGAPIVVDGVVIGAIGASGTKGEDDERVVLAAMKKILGK